MLPGKKISNFQDMLALLNCRRLPGRLNTAESALLLGFQEHDICPLIAAKLLSPLGRPAPNAPKFFASVEIVSLAQDRDWLAQATRAIARHWLNKNNRKTDSRAALSSLEQEAA